MANQSPGNNQKDESSLRDTFIGSFIIGALILLMWLSVFFVYVTRL